MLHADPGYPTAVVGEGCVIGHKTIVHGCEIEDNCLVGMNATVLNGAKIGAGSIVAAGAMVPEGYEFPPCSLIVGIPAKRVEDVIEERTRCIVRAVEVRRAVRRSSKDVAGLVMEKLRATRSRANPA